MNLLDLPSSVLREIVERLSYDEVAKARMVCRRFDEIAQLILNCGFNKVVHLHGINFKRIKALLPRRESERRAHYLARHADILTSIETRISMLSMTYSKYMDLNLCCFIPGRVLDEAFRILGIVSKTSKPLRPHEVLQELRDISSMAIEHFDEKIAIGFKKKLALKSVPNAEGSKWLKTDYLDFVTNAAGALTSSTKHTCAETDCERCERVRNLLLDDEHDRSSNTGASVSQPGGFSICGISAILEQAKAENRKATSREIHTAITCFQTLEEEYKKGVEKIRNLQTLQTTQNAQLQECMRSMNEMKQQMQDVQKRMGEVDALNRELASSLKQMVTGEKSSTSAASTFTALAESYPKQDINIEASTSKRTRNCDMNSSSTNMNVDSSSSTAVKRTRRS